MTGDTGSTTGHATTPDFAALFRELGVNAACSPAELRTAWRRRVSKLHPDLGGSAEDTGRLQELNRLYDAAVDFHARFGRMPGTANAGAASPTMTPVDAATHASLDRTSSDHRTWRRADAAEETDPAAGFGRIPRWMFATVLIAMTAATVIAALSGVRDVDDGHDDGHGGSAEASTAAPAARAIRAPATAASATAIASGMDRNTVRDILGEPLDMHALRWHYGPSWVDFRCDRVVDWYSSPLRPLPVATERAPSTPALSAADRGCD